MCEYCVRRSKRLGLPKHTFGKVKFWAHRATRAWGMWPIFKDKRINIAIEAHIHRILQARTDKRNKKILDK